MQNVTSKSFRIGDQNPLQEILLQNEIYNSSRNDFNSSSSPVISGVLTPDQAYCEFEDIRFRLLQGKATERDYVRILEWSDRSLTTQTASKTLKKMITQVKTIIAGLEPDENTIPLLIKWNQKLNNHNPISLEDRALILQLANGLLNDLHLAKNTKELALRVVRLVHSTTPAFFIDTE